MSDPMPLVTVAIPTFNRAAYLEQAVASALAQDYPRLEVLVSDNASTDGTAAFLDGVRDPRLRVIRQERNLGMVGNWDACLREARGDAFLLLSDDDALAPRGVAALAVALARAPRAPVAYGRVEWLNAAGDVVGCTERPELEEVAAATALAYFEGRRSMPPCGVMLRTEALRAAGGYAASGLRLACDTYAWLAVTLPDGVIAGVPDVVARYRVHAASLSTTTPLDVWLGEHAALARLGEARLAARGGAVLRRFQRAMRRFDANAVLEYTLQTVRAPRDALAAARTLWRYRRHFASREGAGVLASAAARRALPPKARRFLKAAFTGKLAFDGERA